MCGFGGRGTVTASGTDGLGKELWNSSGNGFSVRSPASGS